MIKCDGDCEKCGKYTTFHSHSEGDIFVYEYDCILANKSVRREIRKDGEEINVIID